MTGQEKFEHLAIEHGDDITKDSDSSYKELATNLACLWFLDGIEVAKQDSAVEIAELKGVIERNKSTYFAMEEQIETLREIKIGQECRIKEMCLEHQAEISNLVAVVDRLTSDLTALKPHPDCDISCMFSCSGEADYTEKVRLENAQLQAENLRLQAKAGESLSVSDFMKLGRSE